MASLIRELAGEAWQAAMGLLFVDACALCHSPRPRSGVPALCPECVAALPRLEEPRCAVCGEWFVGRITGPFRCSNCADRRFAFEFATAPLQARMEVREMIHRFKYGRELWLSETLGALLATALVGPQADPRLTTEGDWLLVPVPLHPRRMREREFNQALELTRVLARRTGLRIADVLRRTRYTTVQASLHRKARLANLRGAFGLRRAWPWSPSVTGRRVLLVDDVFTTGATTQWCAQVLKETGGAERVAVLTVARG